MLLEYVQEALARARYDKIEDPEPYYGEVPALRGAWATGKTLEARRETLRETIEGWVIVRLRRGLAIPKLGRIELEPARRAAGR